MWGGEKKNVDMDTKYHILNQTYTEHFPSCIRLKYVRFWKLALLLSTGKSMKYTLFGPLN